MIEIDSVPDVYLSYNQDDVDFVQKLRTFLMEKGVSVFVAPYDMPDGHWRITNFEKIRDAKKFLLIASVFANKSIEVQIEIDHAVVLKPPTAIAILMLDPLDKCDKISQMLTRQHLRNSYDGAFKKDSEALETLLTHLFRDLGKELPTPLSSDEAFTKLSVAFMTLTNPLDEFALAKERINAYRIAEAKSILESIVSRLPEANSYLGLCYFSPTLCTTEDALKASSFLKPTDAIGAFGTAEILNYHWHSSIKDTQNAYRDARNAFEESLQSNPFSLLIKARLHEIGAFSDFRPSNSKLNTRNAIEWYYEASVQGVRVADYWLGRLYERCQDPMKAKRYYTRADECKIADSVQRLAALPK